jgi:hypothetical protein
MTRNKQRDRDAQNAAEAKLAKLMQDRIVEWTRLHADAMAAKAVLDEKTRALTMLSFNMRVAHYTALSEALGILNADLVIGALDCIPGFGWETPLGRDTRLLILAVNAGISLGECMETPDLEPWLRDHGVEFDTNQTASA